MKIKRMSLNKFNRLTQKHEVYVKFNVDYDVSISEIKTNVSLKLYVIDGMHFYYIVDDYSQKDAPQRLTERITFESDGELKLFMVAHGIETKISDYITKTEKDVYSSSIPLHHELRIKTIFD